MRLGAEPHPWRPQELHHAHGVKRVALVERPHVVRYGLGLGPVDARDLIFPEEPPGHPVHEYHHLGHDDVGYGVHVILLYFDPPFAVYPDFELGELDYERARFEPFIPEPRAISLSLIPPGSLRKNSLPSV